MSFTKERRREIYDRTSGYCHICHKKLSFKNYAKEGTRAPWEVEHSIPKSKGGTNHLNNLYAACISCNREKSNGSTRTARAQNSVTRAPLSPQHRVQSKRENAVKVGAVGFALGLFGGPVVALATAAVGAVIGYDQNPDK